MEKMAAALYRFSASLLFTLLLAGCASHSGRDVPGIKNFGKVSNDVWRGGKPDRQGMQTLADKGVNTVWSGAIKERIRRLHRGQNLSKYAQDSAAKVVE